MNITQQSSLPHPDSPGTKVTHLKCQKAPGKDDGYEDRSFAYQQMQQLVLAAQREALLRMRSEGKLSNEVMNRILHELDLEESQLQI
jgi:hypothetical protein